MASGRPDYTSQSLIKGSDAGTHRTVAVDTAGNILTLIKGQFGGAPVTIAVDAAGNILGVLQGDYAGTLKTLAVDDKGRMLAVLTDPEDVFGNPHYMGSAELAARLGSPSMLERSGQVLFMDPGGLNAAQYAVATGGVNSAFTECGLVGVLGPLSYKLIAGPALGNSVAITRRIPKVTFGGVGLEVCFNLTVAYQELFFLLKVDTATSQWDGGVCLNQGTGKITYIDNTGAWVVLDDIPTPIAIGDSHFIKLTMSPTLGKYMRLRFDDISWDMSAIVPFNSVGLARPQIQYGLTLHCDGTADAIAYLGPQIVTVSEV
jgi:hypothetical protein